MCCAKGYKSPYNEDGAENVVLEGEESQARPGEDETLSQEGEDLKQLHENVTSVIVSWKCTSIAIQDICENRS